ncbi:hypothetical protein GC176_23995 [bacterium]|nr:hypothetical protein [bacterium]
MDAREFVDEANDNNDVIDVRVVEDGETVDGFAALIIDSEEGIAILVEHSRQRSANEGGFPIGTIIKFSNTHASEGGTPVMVGSPAWVRPMNWELKKFR